MAALARKEQEQVVLTFERDYGRLVKQYNRGTEQVIFKKQAIKLVEQITHSARPAYFEDDILEFLGGLSTSILQVAKS